MRHNRVAAAAITKNAFTSSRRKSKSAPTGVDITLELVNIGALNGNVTGGITNRFFHTAGVSLRTQGENQLHIGSVFPLDSEFRGNIWIISLGYQRAMSI